MGRISHPRSAAEFAGLSRLRPFPAYLPDDYEAGAIRLETVIRDLPNPVAAAWHQPTGSLIASVNFPDGLPYNFVRICPNGTVVPFSPLAGLSGAVEMIAVRSPLPGSTARTAFTAGDLFATTGDDGRIVRVTDNGRRINHCWAALPNCDGTGAPVALHMDMTGTWGGVMIAAGGDGRIWRIDDAGTGTLVADLGINVSGLLTVPDDPAHYGGLAGKLLAGSPDEGLIYAVDHAGVVRSWTLNDEFGTRIDPEDIVMIPAGENLYGIDFTTGTLTRTAADAFAGLAGNIVLSDRIMPAGTGGLYRLYWDSATLLPIAERIPLSGDIPSEWENIVFAPVKIDRPGSRRPNTAH